MFKIVDCVDEFGDSTNAKLITLKTPSIGTFSDEIESKGQIAWMLILDKYQASFMIFEYGKYKLTASGRLPDRYLVSIKKEDGEIEDFDCKNHIDRIMVSMGDLDRFLGILLQEKQIKIVIKRSGSFPSTYNLGSIDCAGLKQLYESL